MLIQDVWAKVLRLRGKRLIPIFFLLLFICNKSFAYVEKYPPYNFKDGPPDHLEEKSLVDNDNSTYTSEDGKVSVRLEKTENGTELVIAESNDIIIYKDVKDLPVPYAVYMVDLDGNSLEDFIVFYKYRDLEEGIKEERVEIILKGDEGYSQNISYDSLTAGPGDFVDLDKDGTYEVIITGMYEGKGRKYVDYNIFGFNKFKLSNVDQKFEGFPKFVRYTVKANDENSNDLSENEMQLIAEDKNNSIQYYQLKSKNLSSGDTSVKNDVSENIEVRNKLSEKALETEETKKTLEVDDKELDDPLVIKDKLLLAIAALKEKDLQLKIGLEAKDRELKELLAAKDREHKKALEAKDKELLELLARKDKTFKVLQEKELDLESRLKAREAEFEEALTAGEKELVEARIALKSLTERGTGLKSRVEAGDAAVEKEQESSELRSDENMLFKIGVVDVQRVIEESKKGIEARKYFEGLFSLRSEEELARTQDELLEQIVLDIEYIIREYAEKEKFTYVTEKLEGGVVFSEERFNITDEIIRLYDQKVGTSKP